MNTIIKLDKYTDRFAGLHDGDWFYWAGILHIKLESKDGHGNCYSVETNKYILLEGTTFVTPVKTVEIKAI